MTILMALMRRLGCTINYNKVEGPNECFPFLGIVMRHHEHDPRTAGHEAQVTKLEKGNQPSTAVISWQPELGVSVLPRRLNIYASHPECNNSTAGTLAPHTHDIKYIDWWIQFMEPPRVTGVDRCLPCHSRDCL